MLLWSSHRWRRQQAGQHRGGSPPLLEESTSANFLPGKPLHAMRTPMSEVAMKTKISKIDSYLSLQGDDRQGGLHPCLVRLLWRLRDPPLTSTARTVGARITTRAEAIAGAKATTRGGPNASAGASSVPIGGTTIHIHSTSEGGAEASDTIPGNRWPARGG
jgi:hypothetical protein